jgi:hypothetical protein
MSMPSGQLNVQMPHSTQRIDSATTTAETIARRFSLSRRRSPTGTALVSQADAGLTVRRGRARPARSQWSSANGRQSARAIVGRRGSGRRRHGGVAGRTGKDERERDRSGRDSRDLGPLLQELLLPWCAGPAGFLAPNQPPDSYLWSGCMPDRELRVCGFTLYESASDEMVSRTAAAIAGSMVRVRWSRPGRRLDQRSAADATVEGQRVAPRHAGGVTASRDGPSASGRRPGMPSIHQAHAWPVSGASRTTPDAVRPSGTRGLVRRTVHSIESGPPPAPLVNGWRRSGRIAGEHGAFAARMAIIACGEALAPLAGDTPGNRRGTFGPLSPADRTRSWCHPTRTAEQQGATTCAHPCSPREWR